MSNNNKVYDYVTDFIIAELEKGQIPWRKPWQSYLSPAINYVSRKPYRGINTILLPYSGEYLTFKQVTELKGNVKKGEKSHMVIFFKMLERTDKESGEEVTIPMLRYYKVFHISQCEGIESKLDLAKPLNDHERLLQAENLVSMYKDKPEIIDAGEAWYRPSTDVVGVPEIGRFANVEEYYSTLYHELVHSTGHEKRCAREMKTHFGSNSYSREELIAEIGASFLCTFANIEHATIQNSTSYIKGWLKQLKEDNSLIVKASSKAQEAVDYIMNIKKELIEVVE